MNIIRLIENTYIKDSEPKNDSFFWKYTTSGLFSIKFAYHMYLQGSNSINLTNSPSHQWVWKTHALNKIKFFLWLLFNNKLPTIENLFNRNILRLNTCASCPNTTEQLTTYSFMPKSKSLMGSIQYTYPTKPIGTYNPHFLYQTNTIDFN